MKNIIIIQKEHIHIVIKLSIFYFRFSIHDGLRQYLNTINGHFHSTNVYEIQITVRLAHETCVILSKTLRG